MRKECLTISINTIVMLRDLVVIQQMNKQRFTSASVLRRSDSNEKGSTKTVNLEKEKKCSINAFLKYFPDIYKVSEKNMASENTFSELKLMVKTFFYDNRIMLVLLNECTTCEKKLSVTATQQSQTEVLGVSHYNVVQSSLSDNSAADKKKVVFVPLI
jgi:hypothetical protein